MKGKAATCVGDNARLCLVSHNTRPSRPNRRIFHARTSPATKEQGVSRSTELRSCAEVERGGRPGLPVLNSPYGLRGRKATLNSNIQQRSENTWTPVEAESIQVEIDTAYKRKTTIKQYAYSAYTKLVGWLKRCKPRTSTSTFTQLLGSEHTPTNGGTGRQHIARELPRQSPQPL